MFGYSPILMQKKLVKFLFVCYNDNNKCKQLFKSILSIDYP